MADDNIASAKPAATTAGALPDVTPAPKLAVAKAVASKATKVEAPKPAAVPIVAAIAAKPVAKAVAPKPAKAAVAKPKSLPKPVLKTAPAASSPVPKGKIAMPTTTTDFTTPLSEKAMTMFTGMNDRAKAAFEKSTKVSGELTEFTKGNVEAIVASAKTAAKGAETIGQEVAEYSKKSFEAAQATVKSMTAVKSPAELFQLQSDYAKTSFDSAVAEMSKLSEAWVKLAGDVFQPLSSRYAVATEKFKSAAL